MDRSRWSAIAGDPEFWRKATLGGASLMFLLPTPIALGLVNTDLEAEAQRLQAKAPPPKSGFLPPANDLLKLFGSGFGPTIVYVGALLMYAISTIPLGLAYFQLYAVFGRTSQLADELGTKMDISMPVTQVILYVVIALVGLGLQGLVAATLPVALAQYARGRDPRPALAVGPNVLTVVEMGADYWLKAAGVALAMLVMTAVFITGGFGLHWLPSTLLCLVVSTGGFIALVLAGRHSLAHVAAELT